MAGYEFFPLAAATYHAHRVHLWPKQQLHRHPQHLQLQQPPTACEPVVVLAHAHAAEPDLRLSCGQRNNGNVYAITNNRDTTRSQTFTYDPLNRLLSAQNAGTNCTLRLRIHQKKQSESGS